MWCLRGHHRFIDRFRYRWYSKVNAHKYRYREEEKEEINEEKKITHKEAIASFDNLFKYLEDSEDFNDKDLNSLLNLKEKLDFIKSVKSVQTDLTNFVIKKD